MGHRWPPSFRLLQLGVRAAFRGSGMRVLGAAGALAAGLYAWNQGPLAGATGIALATWFGRLYGLAACLWFAYAAARDLGPRAAAFRSKPVDGAQWVGVTWATGLGVWLLLLAAAFLAAALAQLPAAGWPSLASHGLAFVRVALTVGIVGTASFALSRMLRSPLGGIIIGFAWFCGMAGLQNIPTYLRLDYAQNWALFLPAAAFMLLLAALLVERYRRGELRRPVLPAAVTAGVLGLAAAGAVHAYRAAPHPGADERPVWEWVSVQHLSPGSEVPGFWLPDGRGGQVRTADYRGKILVIYLFAAGDVEAARTLPALEAIRREYGERGVQPLAIAFSPDQGDGWALARAGGYSFPIAFDPTTVSTSPPAQSAVAIAYDANVLPLLVVTDRRRRARNILTTDPGYTVEQLRPLVEERLAAEPE